MIFRVIYAILVGTVAGEMSLSDFPCYKPKPPNYRMGLRIVGGIDAKQGEAPYMVGLMKHGGIVCGASIISENFLILAGHCVCNNQNNVVKPTQLKALIGMYKLSDLKTMPDNEIEGTTIKEVLVNKIIVHPDYDCGRKAENDVALLHLKSPIKFSEGVQPLCLATKEDDDFKTGSSGWVTGWGWTDEDLAIGEKPNMLQTANVPIWTNDECRISYRSLKMSNKISDDHICAGGREGGLDSCWADSGGPLVSKTTGNLIGIVSTGVGCGRKGLPGIYTRVSSYAKWIQSNVDKLNLRTL